MYVYKHKASFSAMFMEIKTLRLIMTENSNTDLEYAIHVMPIKPTYHFEHNFYV